MKLSEILKDWPEKLKAGELDKNQCFGYNTALTSCDREIDREALAKALSHTLFKDCDFLIGDTGLSTVTDHIISTMPTWLKRIEK